MSYSQNLLDADISHVIEMAWEDEIPFEAIKREYHLDETAVIQLMRKQLKASSFKMWRKRVTGRKSKHLARSTDVMSLNDEFI